MTPEGRVKKEVDKILKKYNVWYFKPVSRGMGSHGIADYIGCINGKFIAVETKARDDQEPTALQKMQMERINNAGGVAFVATPGNLEKLEALVKEMTDVGVA